MSLKEDETPDKHYTIINPESQVNDDHPLSKKSFRYAAKVINGSEWPLDDLSLLDIFWETSTRAKRRHGNITYHSGGTKCTITVSEHTYENAGFEAIKEVIRHELVHAWQHKNRDQPGIERGHGESFQQWVPKLALQGRCASHYEKTRDQYRYVKECPSCGDWWGKYRLCKSIRQATNANRYCNDCNVYTYLSRNHGAEYLRYGSYTDDEIKEFVTGGLDEAVVSADDAEVRSRS